ncbi:MAG: Aspartate-semialdehyde dehydrogenase, partial [uncultured Phycisphaerae bacterium]
VVASRQRRDRGCHRCGGPGVPDRPRAARVPDQDDQVPRQRQERRQADRLPRPLAHGRGADARQLQGRADRVLQRRRVDQQGVRPQRGEGRRGRRRQLQRVPDEGRHPAGRPRGEPRADPQAQRADRQPELQHDHHERAGLAAAQGQPREAARRQHVPVGERRRRVGPVRARRADEGLRRGPADLEGEVPAPDRQQRVLPQLRDRPQRVQRGGEQDGAGDAQDLRRPADHGDGHLRARARAPRAQREHQHRVRAPDDPRAGPRRAVQGARRADRGRPRAELLPDAPR